MSALAKALDNLNAAFGTSAALPMDEWNVRNLAELAEIGGRKDIADCLRDSLQLERDELEHYGSSVRNGTRYREREKQVV